MPDNPNANQKDVPAKPHQSTLIDPQPQRSPEADSGGRVVRFLLAGFVLLVVIALFWGARQLDPKDSTPSTQLIIVQLNDVYRLDAVRAGKRGGLARVVSVLRQLKAQNPNVPLVVLHAGDFLSPSLESDLFHGQHMIDAMNFLHDIAPLYVIPGNHEFDYPDSDKIYLAEAIFKSNFQWVASNIERDDRLLSAIRDHVRPNIVERFGNLKLGIFGLTLDAAQGGKDRSYAAISGDYSSIARKEIEYLEDEGAEVIIGLTHLNIADDNELAKLKQQHPRFLWIAGGHEHSLDRKPGWAGGALITKGDSNARTVWKVSIIKNGWTFEVREESIPIDESIQPDQGFTRDIEKFYREKLRNVRPYIEMVISTLPNRCYDGTEEAIRDRESDWGDFLADAMRGAYGNLKADIAVLNGGSIRIDDTICDRITFENLERTFAYETPVVFVKLKGKDLRKYILEDSANSKRGDGRFLQVSGVSFRRDLFSGAGEVLKDLKLQSANGQAPFEDAKTYVVAVNKYIFDCGDGYKFREFISDYIPAGVDLRSLTYSALSVKTKKSTNRIVDLPEYVKPPTISRPKWQPLSSSDKRCPL